MYCLSQAAHTTSYYSNKLGTSIAKLLKEIKASDSYDFSGEEVTLHYSISLTQLFSFGVRPFKVILGPSQTIFHDPVWNRNQPASGINNSIPNMSYLTSIRSR